MQAVRIHSSALKHGWSEGDILHALERVHIELDIIDDDPPRTWVFGFAPDATLLELIVLRTSKGDLVIHCMKARKHQLDKALQARGGH
ncbi:toxin [Mycolicibacterium pulveris]|uniref:toxin n=1 Tax=Mycolicibacterium pulveris TaxID=36813 RepID=UPI003CF1DEBF